MGERKLIKKIVMFALAIMLVLSIPTGITAAAKPKAPSGVKAVSVNGTTIKLTWKKVSGVGGYYIYRAPKKTGKFVKIATAKKTATSYTNTRLKPSTYYYYRIYSYKKVKKKNVMSKPSAVVSARTIQRVTGISITGDDTVVRGTPLTLKAVITPSTATYKTTKWTSSNPEVATVNGGVVTGLKTGTTTITATADGKSATKDINVIVKADGVKIEGDETVNLGSTIKLNAVIDPIDTTNKKVIWSSTRPNVAEIDEDGNIKTLKTGATLIYAEIDGKKSEPFLLEVINVPVSDVVIDGHNVIPVDDTTVLTANVLPENSSKKTVEWKSKNEDVATIQVSQDNGNKCIVTGKKYGRAIITATVDSKTAEYEVTVTKDSEIKNVSSVSELKDALADTTKPYIDLKEDIELINPIEINRSVKIMSTYDKSITLDASAPSGFIVNANDVEFEGISFVGERDGRADDEVQSFIQTALNKEVTGLNIVNNNFKYSGVAVDVKEGNVSVIGSTFDRQRIYGVNVDKTNLDINVNNNTFKNIANDVVWEYKDTSLNSQLGAVNVQVLNDNNNTITVSDNTFENIGVNTMANDMVIDKKVPVSVHDGNYMANSAPITISRYDADVESEPEVVADNNAFDSVRTSTLLKYNGPKNMTADYCTNQNSGFTTFGYNTPSVSLTSAGAVKGKLISLSADYSLDEVSVVDNEENEVKVNEIGVYDDLSKTQSVALNDKLDVEKEYIVSVKKNGYKTGSNNKANVKYAGIVVNPSTPNAITSAIDDADEGDTVILQSGTYNEDLVINKDITICGVAPSGFSFFSKSKSNEVKINGSITSSANLDIRYIDIEKNVSNAIVMTGEKKALSVKGCNINANVDSQSGEGVIALNGKNVICNIDASSTISNAYDANDTNNSGNQKYLIRTNSTNRVSNDHIINLEDKASLVNTDTDRTPYAVEMKGNDKVVLAGKDYELPDFGFVTKVEGVDLVGKELNISLENSNDINTDKIISISWRYDGGMILGFTSVDDKHIKWTNKEAESKYWSVLTYTDEDRIISGSLTTEEVSVTKDKLDLSFGEEGNILAVDKNTIKVQSEVNNISFTWNNEEVTSVYDNDEKEYTITVPDITAGENNTLVGKADGYSDTSVENVVWTQDAPNLETLTLTEEEIVQKSSEFKNKFYNKYQNKQDAAAQEAFDNDYDSYFFDILGLSEDYVQNVTGVKLGEKELLNEKASLSIGNNVKINTPLAVVDEKGVRISAPIIMLEKLNADNELVFNIEAKTYKDATVKIKMPSFKPVDGEVFVNPNGGANNNGKNVKISGDGNNFDITPIAHISSAGWEDDKTIGTLMTYFDLKKDNASVLHNDSFFFTKKINKNGEVSYGSTGMDMYENSPYLALYLNIYADAYDYVYTVATTDMYGPKTFNLAIGANMGKAPEFSETTLTSEDITSKSNDFKNTFYNKYELNNDEAAQSAFDGYKNYYIDVNADVDEGFINALDSIKLGEQELYRKTTKLSIGKDVHIVTPLAEVDESGLHIALPVVMLEETKDNKFTFDLHANGYESVTTSINMPNKADLKGNIIVNPNGTKDNNGKNVLISKKSDTNYTIIPKSFVTPASWWDSERKEKEGVLLTYFDLKDSAGDNILTNDSFIFTRKVGANGNISYGSTGVDMYENNPYLASYLSIYNDKSYTYNYTIATTDLYGPQTFELDIDKNAPKDAGFETLILDEETIELTSKAFEDKFYNKYKNEQDNIAQEEFDKTKDTNWFYKISGEDLSEEFVNNVTSIKLGEQELYGKTTKLSIGNNVKLNAPLVCLDSSGLNVSLPIVMLENVDEDNRLVFTVTTSDNQTKTACIKMPSNKKMNGEVFVNPNGEENNNGKFVEITKQDDKFIITPTANISPAQWEKDKTVGTLLTYFNLTDESGNKILANDSFVFTKKTNKNGEVSYGSTGMDMYENNPYLALYLNVYNEAYDYGYTVSTASMYGPTTFSLNIGKNIPLDPAYNGLTLQGQDIITKSNDFKDEFYNKYQKGQDALAQAAFDNNADTWYYEVAGENMTDEFVNNVTSVKLGETELFNNTSEISIGNKVFIDMPLVKVEKSGLKAALPVVILEQAIDSKLTFKVTSDGKEYDAVINVPKFDQNVTKEVTTNTQNAVINENAGRYEISATKYVQPTSWSGGKGVVNTYIDLKKDTVSVLDESPVLFTKKIKDNAKASYGMTEAEKLNNENKLLLYLYLEDETGYTYDYTVATTNFYGPTNFQFDVSKNGVKETSFETLDLSVNSGAAILEKSNEFKNKYFEVYSDNDSAQEAFDANSEDWYFNIPGENITSEFVNGVTSIKLSNEELLDKTAVKVSVGNNVFISKTSQVKVDEDGLKVALPLVMLEEATDNELTFVVTSGEKEYEAKVKVPSFDPSVTKDITTSTNNVSLTEESGRYKLNATGYVKPENWSGTKGVARTYIDLKKNGETTLNANTMFFTKKQKDNGAYEYGITGVEKGSDNKLLLYMYIYEDAGYTYDYTVATTNFYGPSNFQFDVSKNGEKTSYTNLTLKEEDIVTKSNSFKDEFYNKYQKGQDALAQAAFDNNEDTWYYEVAGENMTSEFVSNITSVKFGEQELYNETPKVSIGNDVYVNMPLAKADENGLKIALPIVVLEESVNNELTFVVTSGEKEYEAKIKVPSFDKDVTKEVTTNTQNAVINENAGRYEISATKYVQPTSWSGGKGVVNTYIDLKKDGSSVLSESPVLFTKKIKNNGKASYGMTEVEKLNNDNKLLLYLYLEDETGYTYDYTVATTNFYGPTNFQFDVSKNGVKDYNEEIENAPNGSTVEVTGDLDLTAPLQIGSPSNPKNITLDIGENNLISSGEALEVYGNVTLKGSGEIKTTQDNACTVIVGDSNSSVTINGPTIGEAGSSTWSVYNIEGSVTIENGVLASKVYNQGGTFNMNGGKLEDTQNTSEVSLYNEGGVLNITAGEINDTKGVAVYNDKGSVKMSGGTITSETCGILTIGNGGSDESNVEISGGLIKATSIGVANDGLAKNFGANITMTDGKIESGDIGIYFPGEGTLNISGGEIISQKETGVEIRNGMLNVTGGSIECVNEAETTCTSNSSGSTTVSAGIAVVPHINSDSVSASISGGIIKGYTPIFSKDIEGKNAIIDINVSGGKYNKEIDSSMLEEGYECQGPDENNLYEVILSTLRSINGDLSSNLTTKSSSNDVDKLIEDLENIVSE